MGGKTGARWLPSVYPRRDARTPDERDRPQGDVADSELDVIELACRLGKLRKPERTSTIPAMKSTSSRVLPPGWEGT